MDSYKSVNNQSIPSSVIEVVLGFWGWWSRINFYCFIPNYCSSPFLDFIIKINLLEGDRKTHLDIISSILVEFIDSYASIGICGTMIHEVIDSCRSHCWSELQYEYKNNDDSKYFKTHSLHNKSFFYPFLTVKNRTSERITPLVLVHLIIASASMVVKCTENTLMLRIYPTLYLLYRLHKNAPMSTIYRYYLCFNSLQSIERTICRAAYKDRIASFFLWITCWAYSHHPNWLHFLILSVKYYRSMYSIGHSTNICRWHSSSDQPHT